MATQPALPPGLSYDAAGHLRTPGLALAEIAAQVDTPFYLYDLDQVAASALELKAKLAPIAPRIAYAVKANANISLIRVLAQQGLAADIVSAGELERALAGGMKAEEIIFAGVGKTREELSTALRAGVGQFNLESRAELEALQEVAAALDTQARVALRVNPDVDAGTHAKITTAKADNKFGISPDEALRLIQMRETWPNLRFQALAFHLGSQIISAEPFAAASARLASLVRAVRAEGLGLHEVDLGGGFGVPYGGNQFFDFDTYLEAITTHLVPLDLGFTVEPGRFLVADAGLLITRLIYVKQAAERRFLIVDAAMNDLARPALYDAEHPVYPLRRHAPETPWMTVDLVGPVCESSDIFNRDLVLPDLAQGDLLAIGSAGAYGAVMRSTYNARALAAEVVVRGSNWAVTTPALTPSELLAREQIAPFV